VGSLIDEDHQDAFFIYNLKVNILYLFPFYLLSTGLSFFSFQNVVNDQINVFDITKVPHLVLLLFAGNEINLSNPGKKHSRKCKRIILNEWIEMEITELQLAIFRILQKEIEKLLILYVEKNLLKKEKVSTVKEEANDRTLVEQQINFYQQLIISIVQILMGN
jgi:hypothetical protein